MCHRLGRREEGGRPALISPERAARPQQPHSTRVRGGGLDPCVAYGAHPQPNSAESSGGFGRLRHSPLSQVRAFGNRAGPDRSQRRASHLRHKLGRSRRSGGWQPGGRAGEGVRRDWGKGVGRRGRPRGLTAWPGRGRCGRGPHTALPASHRARPTPTALSFDQPLASIDMAGQAARTARGHCNARRSRARRDGYTFALRTGTVPSFFRRVASGARRGCAGSDYCSVMANCSATEAVEGLGVRGGRADLHTTHRGARPHPARPGQPAACGGL